MTSTPLPDGMLLGAATAAYQIEGAVADDGRGPSIWDVFTATPGKTSDGDTGQIACDHYRRWKEDVALMRELGLTSYRFSVSWPRVQPDGRGTINTTGLDFYDRLVDALGEAGIEPFVTLYHWDLPAALQMEFGGWVHRDSPHWFTTYAEAVYARLGDRVRKWITLNEPWCVVDGGYFHGVHAPGIRDRALGYRAGHNLIRAHAYAVAAYRARKRADGQISFALNTTYSAPATDSAADRAAAERAMLDFAGWFTDPPCFGDYPAVMRERLGGLLPLFSDEETRLLRGSMDFLALNFYFGDVVRHSPDGGPMQIERSYAPDAARTEMDWPITPQAFTDILLWLHRRYGGLPIYVTENGAAMPDGRVEDGVIVDADRIAYLREHLLALCAAARAGCDIRGYFVWSLLDNLEWSLGYSKRFGLIHCDRKTLKRTIKRSGRWYARAIRAHAVPAGDDEGAIAVAEAGR
jgi:beta-glucosidase